MKGFLEVLYSTRSLPPGASFVVVVYGGFQGLSCRVLHYLVQLALHKMADCWLDEIREAVPRGKGVRSSSAWCTYTVVVFVFWMFQYVLVYIFSCLVCSRRVFVRVVLVV